MARLFFRNWWKYQTYHKLNRRTTLSPPPFILTHTKIISDPDYLRLSMKDRGTLHDLMILASQDGGHICDDVERLAISLRAEDVCLEAVSQWFEPCEEPCQHIPEGFDAEGRKCDAHASHMPRSSEVKGGEVREGSTTKKKAPGKRARSVPKKPQPDLLGDTSPNGAVHRRRQIFISVWEEVYGRPYEWTEKKHMIQLTQAAKRAKDDRDMDRRARIYIHWDDPAGFYAGHPPGKFLADWPKWRPKAPPIEQRQAYNRHNAILEEFHRAHPEVEPNEEFLADHPDWPVTWKEKPNDRPH